MRRLIQDFVSDGAVIFDPFSGSGSTLVAARDLGYQAVGCEVSSHWCDVTVERLAQQTLFTLHNNRLQPTAFGVGMQAEFPLHDFRNADESPATHGGG